MQRFARLLVVAGLVIASLSLAACSSSPDPATTITPSVDEATATGMARNALDGFNAGDYAAWSRDWSDTLRGDAGGRRERRSSSPDRIEQERGTRAFSRRWRQRQVLRSSSNGCGSASRIVIGGVGGRGTLPLAPTSDHLPPARATPDPKAAGRVMLLGAEIDGGGLRGRPVSRAAVDRRGQS